MNLNFWPYMILIYIVSQMKTSQHIHLFILSFRRLRFRGMIWFDEVHKANKYSMGIWTQNFLNPASPPFPHYGSSKNTRSQRSVVEVTTGKTNWSQLLVVFSVGFLFGKCKEPLKLFIRKMTCWKQQKYYLLHSDKF